MQDTLDDNICSISEAQDGNGNNEITSPEARTRWYLRHDEQSKNAFTEEDTHTDQTRLITLIADQEVQPAVTITAKTDYIRAVFPTWVTQDRYCDLVLGVCTKNLDVDAIEAIVISFTASNVGDDKKSYSEVISTSELRRLVDIESKKHLQIVKAEQEQSEKRTNLYSIDADDGHIWKWKLHKKVSPITLYLEIVIEIRTWDYIGYNYCNNGSELDDGDVSCGGGSYENRSSNDDYGVLELHFIEILEDAQYYYSQKHRPFLRSVDLNRTGYKDLDSITDDPQTVTDYAISKDGSHIVVTTVAGKEGNERRFIQLWNFQDSSSLSSSVASLPLTLKSSPQDIGSGPHYGSERY
ncbi:hypothetical protein FBU30_003735 [Linnemannia zychae]|nr:hypothetical protein FBU30_003735 [Linnemannia zychae]